MSFYKIPNLYKSQDILLLKEVYALEKIHGTSCHLKYSNGTLTYFSGGIQHNLFVNLFKDREQELLDKFAEIYSGQQITIYGEGYGSCQGMADVYGAGTKFVVFDVQIGDCWLNVEQAERVAIGLGLEFVHYVRVPTDLDVLNRERDRDSVQAIRNGLGAGYDSEGVILRPLIELTLNNGKRLIAKHKKDRFRETSRPRKVVDPALLEVLKECNAVADEWVTQMRLQHVVDKLQCDIDLCNIPRIIPAMQEDIKVEAEGEIVWSKEVAKAIASKTAQLVKDSVKL